MIPISIANDVLYKIIEMVAVIQGYFTVKSPPPKRYREITGANSPLKQASKWVMWILRLNKQDNLSIREMMQIISDTKPNTEVIVLFLA